MVLAFKNWDEWVKLVGKKVMLRLTDNMSSLQLVWQDVAISGQLICHILPIWWDVGQWNVRLMRCHGTKFEYKQN